MNINYDYLSSGIVDEVVEEIIPLLPEIEVDASIATEEQIDTLFPDDNVNGEEGI